MGKDLLANIHVKKKNSGGSNLIKGALNSQDILKGCVEYPDNLLEPKVLIS